MVAMVTVLMLFPLLSFAWLAPLVPCGNTTDDICTPCELVALAKNIIDFFVFVVVIVAALLFVNAGVLYLFSPASPANIAKAHRVFIRTLIGLIIVLASYLFIDFAMKTFYGEAGPAEWGPWNEILCRGTDIEGPERPPLTPGEPITRPPQAPVATSFCSTCVDIHSLRTNGRECDRSASPTGNCQLDANTLDKIITFHNAVTAAGLNMWVTEVWPPTVRHSNPCHYNGTCIDYNFVGGSSYTPTGAEVRSVIEIAEANGLRAVYEVKTQQEKDQLVAQGVPAGSIQVVPRITAAHFSVYN